MLKLKIEVINDTFVVEAQFHGHARHDNWQLIDKYTRGVIDGFIGHRVMDDHVVIKLSEMMEGEKIIIELHAGSVEHSINNAII